MYIHISVGRVIQSVKPLATGWTVRGSNPGGGEIFRTCPDRSWGPPSLLYNGYRIFPGGKVRPGRDADPSLPPRAEVLEEYSYTSTPLRATTGPVTGLLTFTFSHAKEFLLRISKFWASTHKNARQPCLRPKKFNLLAPEFYI